MTITPKPGTDPRESVYQAVANNGWTLRELTRTRTTLEDIFVQITHDGDEIVEEEEQPSGRIVPAFGKDSET